MSEQRSLVRFARDAEDVASGLHTFRDSLPRNATRITATISELFALSSLLREIDNAEGDLRFSSSFYRVQDDLELLFSTLRFTLDSVFDMFARSRGRSCQTLWDELGQKMEYDEGISLLHRLEVYNEFLRGQADILRGRQSQSLLDVKRELVTLYNAQEVSALRIQRLAIDTSAASTPRPRPGRSRSSRSNTPISPVSTSDSWNDYLNSGRPPPRAPNPPTRTPIPPTSPTFTSSSSRTLSSSQTSYSSDRYAANETSSYIHWAQDVFDGKHPVTRFKRRFQLNEPSICQGEPAPSSLQDLAHYGFVQALEIPFDQERLLATFYFRPGDSRARILLTTRDSRRELHYCTFLTNLKLFRRASSLHLCRLEKGGSYSIWAKLNFNLYERMVLFYSTFVAMKRQDGKPVPHEDLVDSFELEEKIDETVHGDVEEYGGVILDGNLQHALRLYKDRTSGVVRLEASALRGPMSEVPLWTAFVTKYANDPAWAEFEGRGVVSLAAMKHEPYVFLSGYELPRNDAGQYILQFNTDQDAREFVEVWTGLCRSS